MDASKFGVGAEAQRDEEAVVGVHGGHAERLVADRDDPLALLAGALGDELLGPERKCLDAARREDGHLVAPGVVQRTHDLPSASPQLRSPGTPGAQLRRMSAARCEQQVDVDADDRRRHEAEHAQRRVAPADVRRVLVEVQEPALAGDVGERRPGIGHRDEVRARARQ